jgi:hypothetical protein
MRMKMMITMIIIAIMSVTVPAVPTAANRILRLAT